MLIIVPVISGLSVSSVALEKIGLIDLGPVLEEGSIYLLPIVVAVAIGAFVDWECRGFREHPEAAIPYGSKIERRKLVAGALISIGMLWLPLLMYFYIFS